MLNKQGKPMYVRKGEEVGGGFFVFRRGKHGGRVKPGPLPFEHPTYESAKEEALRLSETYKGQKFCIMQDLAHTLPQEG